MSATTQEKADAFFTAALNAWIQALAKRDGSPGYSDEAAAKEAARLASITAHEAFHYRPEFES